MIVLIEAGCAECHGWGDEPLITIHQFETEADAKAWAQEQGWLTLPGLDGRRMPLTWIAHPQGGEHIVVGQGSVWITQITTPGRLIEEYVG